MRTKRQLPLIPCLLAAFFFVAPPHRILLGPIMNGAPFLEGKLLPDLSLNRCKHLTRISTSYAPLNPLELLNKAGVVNPRGLVPHEHWQMDVTHYIHLGKFFCVLYALTQTGEKANLMTDVSLISFLANLSSVQNRASDFF